MGGKCRNKERFDFIEFAHGPSAPSSVIPRSIGKACAFLRLTSKTETGSSPHFIALLQRYQPHSATGGDLALDGSPVHPGWRAHGALWSASLELQAVLLNSRQTPLLHLVAAFRDHDFDEGSIFEHRPVHLTTNKLHVYV